MIYRFGKVSFQANEISDVFLVEELWDNDTEQSDEGLLNITDPQFDNDLAWVNGKVPQLKSVNVEGDTTVLQGWFQAVEFSDPFTITVYVECEMAQELIKDEDQKEDEDREYQDIII